jgi:hypothetical protein
MTDPVWFPDVLTGDPHTARPRVERLAQDWARAHAETGRLPEPELVAVQAGSLVFTASVSDLVPSRPGIRIYLTAELRAALLAAAGRGGGAVGQVFDDTALRSCWGALGVALDAARPDTVAGLRARLDALARCQDQLAGLRYVGFRHQPVPLADILADRFAGLTATWRVQATGDPLRDARAALDVLAAAGRETRLDNAAAHLARVAATNRRVRSGDLLDEPLLRSHLTDLDGEQLEQVAAGSPLAVLRLLYAIDRSITPPE